MLPSRQQARAWSRALGWFSLGLGLAELLAARPLARGVGLARRADVVRAYGLRELATGAALLSTRDPRPWMWARVAGDALDLASLAAGVPRRPAGAALAITAVAGVAALDLACAQALSAPPKQAGADYRDRSGFPLPVAEMRGAAIGDFEPPRDLATPRALAPRVGDAAPLAEAVS